MKSQGASGQTCEAERGVEKQDYVRLGKVSKAKEKQFLFIPSALHITKQEAIAGSPLGQRLIAGKAQGDTYNGAFRKGYMNREGVEAREPIWGHREFRRDVT